MNLLLAEELAAELRCCVQKVYRMAREGAIPAIRVGRSWRFDLDEVTADLTTPSCIDSWTRKSGVTWRWAP